MEISCIELTGERAKLLAMEESHIEGLFEAGRDPQIWTYLPMHVETIEDMKHLVSEALSKRKAGSEFPFVIIDQESDQIVGSTRFLDISGANRQLEIGWTWLTPSVWRTRINTECKYLLLQHCFETLGAIRVQLKTDSRNVRSQQAIERIGAVKEGVLRNHRIMHDGYIRDSVYFSVIDEEWSDVSVRLQAMLSGDVTSVHRLDPSQIHVRPLREDEQPVMELLLLADPSERLVQGYVKRGICWVAETGNNVIGAYVLLETRPDTVELVNVAVREDVQGRGLGTRLVLHAVETARQTGFRTIEIGTGNSSVGQLRLYQKCGFRIVAVDTDFFVRHYDKLIFENGIQCRDMIRLKRDI